MLSKNQVSLSAIERYNLKQIQEWRNSNSLRSFFREFRELNYEMLEKWFLETHSNLISDSYFFMISLTATNEAIGVGGINHINWVNRNCQLSLFIGHENIYIDDNGWAKEAAIILEEYAFKSLNLHKIIVELYESDQKKQNLLNDLGYLKEGTLREQVFKDGRYLNSSIYSKIRNF